jgi:anthranilate phosphoribosyltransferase
MFAYILIALKGCDEHDVLNSIKKLPGIKDAHVLFGEWDLIAKVETQDPDSLATFMMDRIRKMPEVKLSSTLIVAK